MIFFFRYADEVSVGDDVLVQDNNEMIPSKVQEVSSAIMKGKPSLKLLSRDERQRHE